MPGRYLPYFLLSALLSFAKGYNVHAQETPGFERFQYKHVEWGVYREKQYTVYLPAKCNDTLYKVIIREMPIALARLKKSAIQDIKDVNLIVYPSLLSFYQTNIGILNPTRVPLPLFNEKAKRIVISYNGDYQHLRDQLYEGLARALWESQIEVTTRNLLTDYPNKVVSSKKKAPYWYKEGCVRYFAHDWPISVEDRLKDILEDTTVSNWQLLVRQDPVIAGHAFCNFLSLKFLEKAPAQIAFQLKAAKGFPVAVRLVTKQPLDSLTSACFAFYKARFTLVGKTPMKPSVKVAFPRKKGVLFNVSSNEDQSAFIYSTQTISKRTVWQYDVRKGKTTKLWVYKLPAWVRDNTTDQYPLVNWNNEKMPVIAAPIKGQIIFRKPQHRDRTTLPNIEGITTLRPTDGNEFLLSSYSKGKSDISLYNLQKNRQQFITRDAFDDSQPVINDAGDILFVSTRTMKRDSAHGLDIQKKRNDTVIQGIFLAKDSSIIEVVRSNHKYSTVSDPYFVGDNRALATSTEFGSRRDVIVDIRSGNITFLNEHKPYQYLPKSQQILFAATRVDSIATAAYNLDEWLTHNNEVAPDTISPWLSDYQVNAEKKRIEDSILLSATDTNQAFSEKILSGMRARDDKRKKRTARPNAIRPYFLKLHSEFFSLGVNNDYFFNKLQPYQSFLGQYKFPELAAMSRVGYADIFENHHFTFAYGLPAATKGSTFFAKYQNNSRMLDWGVSYFRKVEELKPQANRNWVDENGMKYPTKAKVKTHFFELFLKRPLTYYSNLTLQTAIRYDRTIFSAVDNYSLVFPSLPSPWSLSNFSYNIHKTTPTLPLLKKGFDGKLNLAFCKGTRKEQGSVVAFSIDGSYHETIHRYITAVSQLHAGISFGEKVMLYNVGGVDNNLIPRIDTTVDFPQNAPYAFISLITPMRGYIQNSSWGDRYAMVNTDIYFPIFQTLIPIETPLSVINNFQLGILCDVAKVQETRVVNAGSNSLIAAGFCARSTLAGLPLRFDIAWPRPAGKAVWYLSLSL